MVRWPTRSKCARPHAAANSKSTYIPTRAHAHTSSIHASMISSTLFVLGFGCRVDDDHEAIDCSFFVAFFCICNDNSLHIKSNVDVIISTACRDGTSTILSYFTRASILPHAY
jgi:hypothetical protein